VADPSDPHKDLAGVLHDVSNALTVLLGWVGEARSPAATPDAVAYALTIIEQRARIARDLARHAIGAPRTEEQRELGAIVEEVAETLKVEAQRVGVTLVVRGRESTAKVGGALDIAQVLTNLVLNGLAYAPRGGSVELRVELEAKACVLHVTDDGPGVPRARHRTIFEGESTRPGGTGVGLRHSRALSRAWGGDVELVDAGAGAHFRITWPRSDALPRPPTSSLRIQDLEGQRLLLIEDDAMVTQLLETVLEARGATVAIATNPKQIASALAKGPWDAVLVDLSPLGPDPAKAIKDIRTSSPEAALVLVTGQADAVPVDVDDANMHLVRKPFEVSEVLALLRR
jgi:CheY-like chemotaxis protein